MITFRFLPVLVIIKIFAGGHAFLHHRFCSSPSPILMQSFDFSSAAEWDKFYKTSENPTNNSILSDGTTLLATNETAMASVTEWHSSVSLDEIASAVPSNGTCLIIGCGNSNLPDRILRQPGGRSPPRSLVLLDSSQTCLDQLRDRFRNIESECQQSNGSSTKATTRIEYVCGDATELTKHFGTNHGGDQSENLVGNKSGNNDDEEESSLFDIIIDKGLTDAILCGEGWDGPLEKLFHEAANILSTGTGRYLLISYQLPSSTKNFLLTVGEKVGLEWDFDVYLTGKSFQKRDGNQYQQVSVAMARRIANQQTFS